MAHNPFQQHHRGVVGHCLFCGFRTGARRTISLEARAAPHNAAQAAPKGPSSTARNTAARSSSNGAQGSTSREAASPSTTNSDVLQSAEDDLDMEDTVRAKSHAQVGIMACCLALWMA